MNAERNSGVAAETVRSRGGGKTKVLSLLKKVGFPPGEKREYGQGKGE